MLASILAFMGSLFNLTIDVIFKSVVALVVLFLIVIAFCFGFALLLIQLF